MTNRKYRQPLPGQECEHCQERGPTRLDYLRGRVCRDCDSSLDEMEDVIMCEQLLGRRFRRDPRLSGRDGGCDHVREARTGSQSMTLGERIAAARAKAGLTQIELARRAGIAQPTLSILERGQKDASWATLTRIAAALGTSVWKLVRPL